MLPSVLIGLHALAWPLVERRLHADKQRAAERFEELHGTGLGSSDPAKLAEAAHHGRIDTLLLTTSPSCWERASTRVTEGSPARRRRHLRPLRTPRSSRRGHPDEQRAYLLVLPVPGAGRRRRRSAVPVLTAAPAVGIVPVHLCPPDAAACEHPAEARQT
jgi:hypothetical protein